PVRHQVEIVWGKLKPTPIPKLPLVVELGSKLWGPATPIGKEYRFGADQSKVIDLRRNIWFDFETNEGGFIKELMKKVETATPEPGPLPKSPASPHVWRDPPTIPPRDFLYGDHIIRGYVTGDVSMGGVGKTSEAQVEIAAMITGRNLLGVTPKHPYRVWYINLEDPQQEIDRRFAAIFKHYEITQNDLGN